MTIPDNPDRLCLPARRLALFYDQIKATITKHTTTEQIQEARSVLTSLYETLARELDFMHYADPPGHIGHTCLRDVYVDADAKLKLRSVLQPEPAPEPPEEPHRRLTPEQVYDIFEAMLSEDLFFGEERESR